MYKHESRREDYLQKLKDRKVVLRYEVPLKRRGSVLVEWFKDLELILDKEVFTFKYSKFVYDLEKKELVKAKIMLKYLDKAILIVERGAPWGAWVWKLYPGGKVLTGRIKTCRGLVSNRALSLYKDDLVAALTHASVGEWEYAVELLEEVFH